ncbi:MAG: CAP domain-containing protein [Bacteroidia bacterium]
MQKLLLILFVFFSCYTFAQKWTAKQIAQANTAKDIPDLSKIEKKIITLINLARLYPKDFAKIEVFSYTGSVKYNEDLTKSTYKTSLMKELNSMAAVAALQFDKAPYENAKCLAQEQGTTGGMGHKRTKCKDGPFAECCSYGAETAKEVLMQWLIDDKHPDLGHRKNCLSSGYKVIGVSEHSHLKWQTCSVADFR